MSYEKCENFDDIWESVFTVSLFIRSKNFKKLCSHSTPSSWTFSSDSLPALPSCLTSLCSVASAWLRLLHSTRHRSRDQHCEHLHLISFLQPIFTSVIQCLLYWAHPPNRPLLRFCSHFRRLSSLSSCSFLCDAIPQDRQTPSQPGLPQTVAFCSPSTASIRAIRSLYASDSYHT